MAREDGGGGSRSGGDSDIGDDESSGDSNVDDSDGDGGSVILDSNSPSHVTLESST